MNKTITDGTTPFLAGAGEMGSLIRQHDWSATALGTPDQWPPSLRTTLGILLHSAFPMALFWGPDLLFFYNDAYRVSLGETGKYPALGQRAADVWVEIWDFFGPTIEQVMTEGQPIYFEDQLVVFTRNGQPNNTYWTYNYGPAFGEGDQINGVVITCIETTGQVLARQTLEEKSSDLELALDNGELGTCKIDLRQGTVVFSKRLCTWWGVDRQQTSVSSMLSVIFPADRPAVEEVLRQAMAPDGDGQHDMVYRVPDPATGQLRYLHSKGKTTVENGQGPILYGTVQDVTAQVLAQQELTLALNEQRKLINILNSSHEYIGLADADTAIQYKNPASLAMLGWESVEKKKVLDCIYPADHELARHLLTNLRETGYISQEIRFINARTGQPVWIQWNAVANKDPITGDVLGLVSVSQNITRQRESQQALQESEERYRTLAAKLEQQVQERTDALRTSNAELLETNSLLARSNENLEKFAYVASHDLQEPLRKIQSFGDMLKAQYASQLGEGVDYLERMQSAASRMSTLIRDLLTYSRIATQRETVSPVPLSIAMQSVLGDLDLQIQETGAIITVAPLPTVMGDASQLGQLLQNLLGNALKFRRPGVAPVIEVNSWLVAGHALLPAVKPARLAEMYHRIDITDNGIGFDEKYLDRIFQVFQRLNGNNQFAGTGIGLAICEKVVANHGGAITARSQPGQGATFSLYFPQ